MKGFQWEINYTKWNVQYFCPPFPVDWLECVRVSDQTAASSEGRHVSPPLPPPLPRSRPLSQHRHLLLPRQQPLAGRVPHPGVQTVRHWQVLREDMEIFLLRPGLSQNNIYVLRLRRLTKYWRLRWVFQHLYFFIDIVRTLESVTTLQSYIKQT